MSSCSDEDLLLNAEFLEALAGECSLLGSQIALLGETLSAAVTHHRDPVTMQQFDHLAQSAQTQARIITFIAQGLLRGAPRGGQQLLDMTGTIPLAEMRARLRLLLGVVAEEGGDGEDLWGAA